MSLNTVQEIEHAIRALTPSELEELYAWLDQHCQQPIDARLKADLDAGHIDDRINRAVADHKAGNTQPL
jgi:hypothetical protein